MSEEHYLNKSEVKYYLINTYKIREYLPRSGEKVVIVDDEGTLYPLKMHSKAARIDGLGKWYANHPCKIGDKVSLTINPDKSLKISLKLEEPPKDNNEIPLSWEELLEDFLELHLELVEKGLKIYTDENGVPARQYPTNDAGTPDLICLDKDNKFVVIELKKRKGSDETVGQITRYMGWVKENLSNNQPVRGIIIVQGINKKLEYSASVVPNVQIKYYKITLDFVPKQELM